MKGNPFDEQGRLSKNSQHCILLNEARTYKIEPPVAADSPSPSKHMRVRQVVLRAGFFLPGSESPHLTTKIRASPVYDEIGRDGSTARFAAILPFHSVGPHDEHHGIHRHSRVFSVTHPT